MNTAANTFLVPTSRLYPPRRGRGVLPRPRLEQLAPNLMERTLTLLTAPPGFGKTTLAAAWVEALSSSDNYCAWLTLDESDNSPARLLYALTAALQHTQEQPLASFKLSQDLPLVSLELLATQLLNDIDALDKPLLLVLDDCHLLSEATLDNALRTLLRHPPRHLHILTISRTHLPEKLVNYVQGEPVLELNAEALRFRLEETKDLLSRAGIDITAADLAKLQEATAGWSTALRAYMLGANAQSKKLQQNLVPRSLNVQFDEVLEGLPNQFIEQLLPLSLLSEFTRPLLEHCFADSAAEFLEQIESGQFFISSVNTQVNEQPETVFRFHPLFRQYLSQRYQQNTELAAINEFRLSLAHWLAANQQRIAAISLALEANALELAEQWISQCAMDLVEQGELYTLMQWERQLREQLPVLPARMRLALGWAATLGMQQEKAQELLASLKGSDQINPWEYRALNAMLLAFDGRGEMAGRLALECLPHFNQQPWIENVLLNVQRYGYLHSANWQAFYNLPPLADQALSRNRYVFNRLYQYGIEAIAEIQQARLETASKQLQLSMQVLDENHADNSMLYAMPRAFLAQIYLLQGDFEEAQKQLDASQPFTVQLGFPELIIAALGSQIKLDIIRGRLQSARLNIEKIEALGLQRLCPLLLSYALRERCRLSLKENKISEAKACNKLLQNLMNEQQSPPLPLKYSLLVTQLAIAATEALPLGTLLQDAERLAETMLTQGRQLQHVKLQLLLALALDKQGDSSAKQRLEHWQQVAKVYRLEGMLTSLGLDQQANSPEDLDACLSLTVKERLILQEVAQGQSNKEIARTMGVTPETVKTHLKNIYAKLGVSNRTQAALMIAEA